MYNKNKNKNPSNWTKDNGDKNKLTELSDLLFD